MSLIKVNVQDQLKVDDKAVTYMGSFFVLFFYLWLKKVAFYVFWYDIWTGIGGLIVALESVISMVLGEVERLFQKRYEK